MKNVKAYRAWAAMKNRCKNKNCLDYKHYGARGITYDEKWEKFPPFLADMGAPPTALHSLDRIDNNGKYSRENCRWASAKVQARNRRNAIYLTLNGERKLFIEWVNILRLPYGALKHRIFKAKWDIHLAISTPFFPGKKYRRKRKNLEKLFPVP